MALQSPEELAQYCLRRLGAPLNNIEIDQSQIDDLIEDAVQYFIEYHYDGSSERYVPYLVTDNDVNKGYLTMPDNIVEIVYLYDPARGFSGSSEEFERLNFHIANDDVLNFLDTPGDGLAEYHLAFEQIATLKRYFQPDRYFNFNKTSRALYTTGNLVAGNCIYVRCYVGIDPDFDVNVYNDHWMKEYATALFHKQWGFNVKKYKGVQLAGGVEIDGQQIYEEGNDEVLRLREEFQSRYTAPPKFMMG